MWVKIHWKPTTEGQRHWIHPVKIKMMANINMMQDGITVRALRSGRPQQNDLHPAGSETDKMQTRKISEIVLLSVEW